MDLKESRKLVAIKQIRYNRKRLYDCSHFPQRMTDKEKLSFYEFHCKCIHPVIKSDPNTKPLWRRLYWSTGKNSNEYKSGCVDILEANFPYLFNELHKTYRENIAFKRQKNMGS